MKSEEKLIALLKENKLSIASIESLTAGLFASKLANVPGASSVLKGALVTYQSEIKTKVLGIKKSTIDKYGVVSEVVAKEMAVKGQKLFNSDITISFTGNAGPKKEKGKAEVGRVYSALLIKGKKDILKIYTHIYKGDRNEIRMRVCSDAIKNIISCLSKNEKKR